MGQIKLIVQADPDWPGKHPYHKNRYITTDDFNFNDEHTSGQIICKMRDLDNQAEMAHLFASAPALLEACKRFVKNSPCKNHCKKDDMTCDTQFAKKVIAAAESK